MVRLFRQVHTYEHAWADVVQAFWNKYPNSLAPHVLEVDVYHREIDAASGDLFTRRIISCASSIPSFMTRVGLPSAMVVQEESVTNARVHRLVVRASNLTGSAFLKVEETCIYEQHPTRPDWTLYTQEAEITAHTPVLSDTIERYILSSMTAQAAKGLDAVEAVIARQRAEGAAAAAAASSSSPPPSESASTSTPPSSTPAFM